MTLNVRTITSAPEVLRLRPADEHECALDGMNGQEALDFAVTKSLHSYEVRYLDRPIVFWGYRPGALLGPACWAWMLTTPAADDFPLVVGLGSRRVLDSLLELYPAVAVAVDPDHAVALRWLTWLGFEHIGPIGRFNQMIVRRK